MAVLDIQSYEPLTVASFDCRDSVGMALPLLRDPSPAVPRILSDTFFGATNDRQQEVRS